MKKTIFFIVLFTMATFTQSCSSDDATDENYQFFNPPAWIQGEWTASSELPNFSSFEFTKNDFKIINLGVSTSYNSLLQKNKQAKQTSKVTEDISENKYKFKIDMGIQALEYHFKKITADKIEWVNHPTASVTHIYLIRKG